MSFVHEMFDGNFIELDQKMLQRRFVFHTESWIIQLMYKNEA